MQKQGKPGPWLGRSVTVAPLYQPRCLPGVCLDSGETLGFGLGHAEEGGEELVPNLSPPRGIYPVVSPGPSFFQGLKTFLQLSF